jgi:hypothetical protein
MARWLSAVPAGRIATGYWKLSETALAFVQPINRSMNRRD